MDTPRKYQPTIPYLTVKGAADAIAFYQKAFGAIENMRMAAEDGTRLMHAELTVNGGNIMLSDEFPNETCHPVQAPTAARPAGVGIALPMAAPADLDALYARAVGAGCTGLQPPLDAPFGIRFAMINCPFGHRWLLSAPLAAH